MIRALTVAALFLSTSALAKPSGDTVTVTHAVQSFAQGDVQQRVDLLEQVLDADFTMNAVMDGKIVQFTRQSYLEGIAAKRFGGDKAIEVGDVRVHGDTANVELELNGAALAFHHYVQLAKSGDEWKLVHSAVQMTPVK